MSVWRALRSACACDGANNAQRRKSPTAPNLPCLTPRPENETSPPALVPPTAATRCNTRRTRTRSVIRAPNRLRVAPRTARIASRASGPRARKVPNRRAVRAHRCPPPRPWRRSHSRSLSFDFPGATSAAFAFAWAPIPLARTKARAFAFPIAICAAPVAQGERLPSARARRRGRHRERRRGGSHPTPRQEGRARGPVLVQGAWLHGRPSRRDGRR